MKTFKIIGLIIFLIIIGFFIGAFFLPKEVNVVKKIVIKAPIERTFMAVNNFRSWSKWSLWDDSTMSTKYEGPQSGIGAKMIWNDKKEGVGVMSIIECIENEKITTELAFTRTESTTKSHFTFTAVEGGVEVSWGLKSEGYGYPFGRYAGWMISKGLNKTFSEGLAKLKTLVESDFEFKTKIDYTVEVISFEGRSYISLTDSCKTEQGSKKMAEMFATLFKQMEKSKIQSEGIPIAIWNKYEPNGISSFTAALPISANLKVDKGIKTTSIAPTKVAFVKHLGSYETSYDAWMTLDNYMKANKLEMNGNPWEEYVIGPAQELDSTKWITNIYYPIK